MPEPRPRQRGAAAALTFGSFLIALGPYPAVIQGWAWVPAMLFAGVLLIVLGLATRRMVRRGGLGVRILFPVIAQLLLLAVMLITVFGRGTLHWTLLPTGVTGERAVYYVSQAVNAIATSEAPMPATDSLMFVVTASFGLFAILIDQLLAFRQSVLASVMIAVVGATPTLLTGGRANLWWFVACAVWILLLVRHSIRYEPRAPHPAPRWLAAIVGIAAIGGSLVLAPELPTGSGGWGSGPLQRVTLNATLNLGDDLREPSQADVLTLATDADRAPYLRVSTFSRFNGRQWFPDRFSTQAARQGFGDVIEIPLDGGLLTTEPDDEVTTQSTSIRMQNVEGDALPVPYPALTVSDAHGSWRTMPDNRTLLTGGADAQDADYTIISQPVVPTREQMQAARTVDPGTAGVTEFPSDVPAELASLAAAVTAGADNDYDRLLALQSFFRSEFSYSLDAPVEDGFDGTNTEAIGRFLEVRTGYCVHFASAFALMARSLDMPARVVVGFLPGIPTGDTRGDEKIYQVRNDQLHAWPEVHFAGWGWIPFEPTASLGTPTQFATGAPDATTPEDDEPDATPTPEPTTPEQTETPDALIPDDGFVIDPETGEVVAAPSPPVLPILGGVLAVILLLLVPALVRLGRRGARMARASRGSAAAAWIEVEDTLIDLGIAAPDTETARMRGERLQADSGVHKKAMGALVEAIERASYAPPGAEPRRLQVPLRRTVRQVTKEAAPAQRRVAFFLPRSLLRRR